MVKLPDKPMMARLFDRRVGYFSNSATDYSHDEYKAERIRVIDRWRLEKKDPDAAISEPVNDPSSFRSTSMSTVAPGGNPTLSVAMTDTSGCKLSVVAGTLRVTVGGVRSTTAV